MIYNIHNLNIDKSYLAPSILSANFCNLEYDIKEVLNNEIKILHIDVMDGNFVKNISIGQPLIKSIRKLSNNIIFDVHLMINNPIRHIESMIEVGANHITFHYEVMKNKNDMNDILKEIQKYKNISFGIAINPETNPDVLYKYLDNFNMIVIMSVHPGFGGQKFIEHSENKISIIKKNIQNIKKNIYIQVDGGINLDNISKISQMNVNVLVVGTDIFRNKIGVNMAIKKLNNSIITSIK